MAQIFRFSTRRFDVSRERPNPINPIGGESLLLWLREQIQERVQLSDPDTEDWGWYSYLVWEGRSYMVGASASDADETGDREWVLQIHKHRSAIEALLGRAKMEPDDPCARYLLSVLRRDFPDVLAEPPENRYHSHE